MSVLPVTLSIALDVSDGRHHIVELWFGIAAEENPEMTVGIRQKIYFSLQRDNLMVSYCRLFWLFKKFNLYVYIFASYMLI